MTEKPTNRRDFLRTLSACGTAMLIPGLGGCINDQKLEKRVQVVGSPPEKRYAIAMWDYSWLLRHHPYGEFENWDYVLDQLVLRGYNAVRIDCFPQFIASDSQGKTCDKYWHPKDNWKPTLWGNAYTVQSSPREGLLEFLSKCRERRVKVLLSTWFKGHGTERNLQFQSTEDFIRAWDETLKLIDQNNLLDNTLYVDLLNEFPNWHGFEWLKEELKSRNNMEQYLGLHPEIEIPDSYLNTEGKRNPLQRFFLDNFLNTVIGRLREKWPHLNFLTSFDLGMPINEPDLHLFGALDYHLWCVNCPNFSDAVFSSFVNSENDSDYYTGYPNLKKRWKENKSEVLDWMNRKMREVAQAGTKYGIPVGNTEGWGAIFWMDHPALEWNWIKEAGEACAEMAVRNGYTFICSSNFTHPQFSGIWNDIKWHQDVNEIIRG